MFRKTIQFIDRAIYSVSRVVNGGGVWFLAAMMLFIAADVFLRYIFNRPTKGSYEIIQFMMLIFVFLGLAYAGARRSHIALDVVVSRLPQRAQALIDSIAYLLSLGVVFLMVWQSAVYARVLWQDNVTGDQIPVPVSPFLLVVSFGCLLFFIVLLAQFLDSIARVMKR